MFILIALAFTTLFANWWNSAAFDPQNEVIQIQKNSGFAGRIGNYCIAVASLKTLKKICFIRENEYDVSILNYEFKGNVISASTYLFTTHFVDEYSNIYKVYLENDDVVVTFIGNHPETSQYFSYGLVGVGCSRNKEKGCLYCVNDECSVRNWDFTAERYNDLTFEYMFPNYAEFKLYCSVYNTNDPDVRYFMIQDIFTNDWTNVDFKFLLAHFPMDHVQVVFPWGFNSYIMGDSNSYLSMKFEQGYVKDYSRHFVDYSPSNFEGSFSISDLKTNTLRYVLYGVGGVRTVASYGQCVEGEYWNMGSCDKCVQNNICLMNELY